MIPQFPDTPVTKHVVALERFNKEERWSWDDLARAVDAAGVPRETPGPWTGKALCELVGKVRRQTKWADKLESQLKAKPASEPQHQPREPIENPIVMKEIGLPFQDEDEFMPPLRKE
ncbi:MAG: hypothetical protein JOY71_00690 [Acetobacteraceae bacterium]|nr:hypothetical protein [Acetobacteraceae bacterium]